VQSFRNKDQKGIEKMIDSAKNKPRSNELSLQASEVRYRRLFETAQDGILILNAKNWGNF